ncbi:hypothetical protein M011DRAFT_519818 [Sporormia fimetaria CBS 119925]|uniref:Phosphoribosyltransferase domain-containing protein n=1 Tax=Sporormia fimetaria CBS 119925 TaxID=1340428 RepID=A0A6A6VA75_9PLEO|nr:hypothetical protein M011DRAFT_519818 [Sporormia fimetaria CBS 119925]
MQAHQIDPSADLEAAKKPAIIGIYGVSGSGESHFLGQLQERFGTQQFQYYDGSTKISEVTVGGLAAFQAATKDERYLLRQVAIERIQQECSDGGRIGIVTGHAVLLDKDTRALTDVRTAADARVYTHIIYLDTSAETVLRYWQKDNESKKKRRPELPLEEIEAWIAAERDLVEKYTCLFGMPSVAIKNPGDHETVMMFLEKLRIPDQKHDFSMVVLDADKTLAPVDTGIMFWEIFGEKTGKAKHASHPLKKIFEDGQTRAAFLKAAQLYEDECSADMYEAICTEVANKVELYPEMLTLLQRIQESHQTGAVVVTCGLRRMWEKVLERAGLSHVSIIGGGRLSDGCLVYGEIKAALVARLKRRHHLYVWAIGDSPLDLQMMLAADDAVVVVGEQASRSTTMESKLADAIEAYGTSFRVRQVLLPANAPHRLDTTRLPFPQHWRDRMYQATDTDAAKILATATRDANNRGPVLRQAHEDVGRYLATQFLGDVVGLERYDIEHVQGRTDLGYRLANEEKTLIVALMRAGEPLAFGINSAMPSAAFLHAKKVNDITMEHLKDRSTVILADGVVNSGKTVVEFVDYIRAIDENMRIVVVAGVTQADAEDKRLFLVTLRVSKNKYKGIGGTDTGHRLFNTTFLE